MITRIGNLIILFSVAALLVGFTPESKVKLKKVKVEDGLIVFVPKAWRPMDDLDFNERYPSVRAPILAYTDPDRLTDFSVNISATQWPDANVDMAKEFFKAAILNSFDRVEMIDEGIKEVKGGNKLAYFEFESTIKGRKDDLSNRSSILKYSYLQYYVSQGRTLVFSFNCPRRLRADWEEAAKEMMDKVKIK